MHEVEGDGGRTHWVAKFSKVPITREAVSDNFLGFDVILKNQQGKTLTVFVDGKESYLMHKPNIDGRAADIRGREAQHDSTAIRR
jgi:hypothetical protein